MTSENQSEQEQAGAQAQSPIVIKKYANRRLYNMAGSSYVTLDDLSQMVKEGVDFVVQDAKSGEDITRQVLTQIIVEEEAKGESLLPVSFLRQLISFYDHGMSRMVPGYLEQMMEALSGNHETMARAMQEAMDRNLPLRRFEEMSRQNMAVFEQAMRMFSPFPDDGAAPGSGAEKARGETQAEQIESLREQVELLRRQLDELAGEKKDGPRRS